MKRVIFLFGIYFTIMYPASVKAQWDDMMVDSHHTGKMAIGAYGDLDFSSNSVTSAFAYNFLAGNYITDALKKQVVSNLGSYNRIGFAFNYGIYGVLYNDTISKKRVFNFFFALRHKKYFNTSFSSDDFNLAFYGNAGYAGRTAEISPFSFNNISYQQGEIGIVCTNFGGGAQFGVGLSFLAGQQYASISSSSASLYTDTYGQYLLLNANAQAMQSDSGSKNVYNINGYGASMDLYFRAPYKVGRKSGNITISATDMGFMWWNQRSLTFQKDTSYNYSGIVINGLTDLQNPSFKTFSKDSIQNKYFPYSKGAFYSPIPTTLNINSNTALTEKFHLEMGYTYVFNANAVGYIYAQGDKYFSHGWKMALQIGYGGYTTLNGTFMLSKQFKSSGIRIKVYDLPGLILPNKFGGAGSFLEYSHSF